MLLVIDIGNSNIVLGTFEGDVLTHSWRIATNRQRTADEYAMLCRNLFDASSVSPKSVDAIVISSVVPPLNEYFETLARQYFGIEPSFIWPEGQELIRVRYNPVSDVGADRIVNAVGALQLGDGPLVIVDFGTATTFDAINADNEYVGGIISPGIGISAEALFLRASRLPRIDIRVPDEVIGSSTTSSMQSGIFYGYVGLVDGILERMAAQLGQGIVIATGGFAALIAGESKRIDRVEPDLTLVGLKAFFDAEAVR